MKTFKIIGNKYSNEKKFYSWDKEQKYFYYEKIDSHTFPPKKFESLDHAEEWLLDNFPEYYFGACIVEVVEEGKQPDFSCIAVPEYYEMELKTSDREFIIKEIYHQLVNRK